MSNTATPKPNLVTDFFNGGTLSYQNDGQGDAPSLAATVEHELLMGTAPDSITYRPLTAVEQRAVDDAVDALMANTNRGLSGLAPPSESGVRFRRQ